MLTRRAFLIAAALTGTCACRKQPSTPTTFESLLNEALDRYRVPAMAAVAVRAQGIVHVAACGVCRKGDQQKVSPSSHFHLGSLTKAIAATVLATLVEQKKLDWLSKPLEVFPDWRGTIHPAYSDITLNDLFRHRAGLPPFRDQKNAPEFRDYPAPAPRTEIAHWILQHPPIKAPGTVPAYSNAGPAIASAMAERVTGETWESLVRKRIFEPLGIEGGFGSPAAADPAQPWGHEPSWHGLVPVDPHVPSVLPDFFKPSGDIHMNLSDYGRFLQVHLRGLQGHDSLLKASTIQHIHTPVDSCGLGWGVGLVNGLNTSGHVGGDGSFLAVVSIWHTRNLAIAVAGNAGTDRAEHACHAASEAMFKFLDNASP